MLKITNTVLFAITSVVIISSPSYAEQKIRNLSLSVEETNKQLATPQAPKENNHFDQSLEDMAGFENDKNVGFDSNMQRQIDDINSRYDNMESGNINIDGRINNDLPDTRRIPPPNRVQGQQGFINRFCNSGYISKTASTPAQQDCMDTQRQQACERFSHATVNVQRTLSQAIDCELNSTNMVQSGCDGMDASRLDLLKQYWQDEDISYTILFLPDMVLNSTDNCSASNKHGTKK